MLGKRGGTRDRIGRRAFVEVVTDFDFEHDIALICVEMQAQKTHEVLGWEEVEVAKVNLYCSSNQTDYQALSQEPSQWNHLYTPNGMELTEVTTSSYHQKLLLLPQVPLVESQWKWLSCFEWRLLLLKILPQTLSNLEF